MKKCARATWMFSFVLASTVSITAIQAQEVDAVQSSEGAADESVPDSKPSATSTAKNLLQKLGQAVNSLRGGTSSAKSAQDNAAVDISAELVRYLERTVRDHQLTIDRRNTKRDRKSVG